MMAPLREVADEIVIAADDRALATDVEEYRIAADRVVSCEFDYFEYHLDWLHAQCTGDWILRLDGDEVVSPALVAALPDLTEAADARQYWLPRRWIDSAGRGWLNELPWAPDYQNRLVRNDNMLGFAGRQHTGADPAFPARYLREPIYHLLCALETSQERIAHSLHYELAEPGRVAPGGGPCNATYYLPERFARRPAEPLPEEDRLALRAFLDCPDRLSSAKASREVEAPSDVPIRILEADLRFHASETRGILVEVANRAVERWPGGLDEEPRVRLSYHWRGQDESLTEGVRTRLPAPLEPGESALQLVTVVAPDSHGRYELEIDLVHEGVRWFGEGERAEVEVVPPKETGRDTKRRPRLWFARRQRIPRVIHRVWLGREPMPEEQVRFGETWREHHPRWEQRLWTDADQASLGIPEEAVASAADASELSNLFRYHLLAEHGGVYVDTDFECLRSLEPLLRGVEAFAAYEVQGRLGAAIIGCMPGHEALRCLAAMSTFAVGLPPTSQRTGPAFFTHVLWNFPEVTRFPPDLFYPYLWDEPDRRHGRFPDAYAVQHSAG